MESDVKMRIWKNLIEGYQDQNKVDVVQVVGSKGSVLYERMQTKKDRRGIDQKGSRAANNIV